MLTTAGATHLQVKANLHVAFTASPVGEAFRVRSQRFLATINSTVIDWFQPWPEASLHSVARKFLDDADLGDDVTRAAVVEFMPMSFAAVNRVGAHAPASAWRNCCQQHGRMCPWQIEIRPLMHGPGNTNAMYFTRRRPRRSMRWSAATTTQRQRCERVPVGWRAPVTAAAVYANSMCTHVRNMPCHPPHPHGPSADLPRAHQAVQERADAQEARDAGGHRPPGERPEQTPQDTGRNHGRWCILLAPGAAPRVVFTSLACPLPPQRGQADVDVLVEDARKMAVEVEHKVASANVFADQVGVEKEKVAAENESAKVEADKCAVIAKEVSEKQVRGRCLGQGVCGPGPVARQPANGSQPGPPRPK